MSAPAVMQKQGGSVIIYLYILGGLAWAVLALMPMNDFSAKAKASVFFITWLAWPVIVPIAAIALAVHLRHYEQPKASPLQGVDE